MQPIYLNLKLRHGTGKTPDAADVVDDAGVSTAQERPPLRKVISINGEEVEISDDLNIHDYATFEREQHITSKFMSSIKRKDSDTTSTEYPSVNADKPMVKKPSFKIVARDVMRVENVLSALKHYSHRSDTETETDEEILETDSEDQADSKPGVAFTGGKRNVYNVEKETIDKDAGITLAEPDSPTITSSLNNNKEKQPLIAENHISAPNTPLASLPISCSSGKAETTAEFDSITSSPRKTSMDKRIVGSLDSSDGQISDGAQVTTPNLSPKSTTSSLSNASPDDVAVGLEQPESPATSSKLVQRTNPPARRLSQTVQSKQGSGCDKCCVLL